MNNYSPTHSIDQAYSDLDYNYDYGLRIFERKRNCHVKEAATLSPALLFSSDQCLSIPNDKPYPTVSPCSDPCPK